MHMYTHTHTICMHICILIFMYPVLYRVFALVSNRMNQRTTQVGQFQEDYRQANRNKFGDVPPDLARHQVAGWWALALQYSTALCVLFVLGSQLPDLGSLRPKHLVTRWQST